MNEQIKPAKELGLKGANKYIRQACLNCGKERWVALIKGRPKNVYCNSCSKTGERNPNWKNRITARGYIQLKLKPDNFFYPTAREGGSIHEHRLVMAKHLGRNLHPWEIVHHKNGIKSDNRIENLQLFSYDKHNGVTILEREIKRLKEENKCLKKQLQKVSATA